MGRQSHHAKEGVTRRVYADPTATFCDFLHGPYWGQSPISLETELSDCMVVLNRDLTPLLGFCGPGGTPRLLVAHLNLTP